MSWEKLLAYITGSVDEELLLKNEYLVTENHILRRQIEGRLRLTDEDRRTLGEIGKRLGKQARATAHSQGFLPTANRPSAPPALEEVASIVKPETILGWHRQQVAKKCDGSRQRKVPGRPKVDPALEALVLQMARENQRWGYDRIVGALAALGYSISDQTVGNILNRHGIEPAPERQKTTTWTSFIRTHMAVLVATDFFTAEVWTCRGLVTYHVLFFIYLDSRQVHIAGMTPHPNEAWMMQVARNETMEGCGFLKPGQYLIHDRDGKYCPAFQRIVDDTGVTRLPLPPRSPNLNAYAERWVRSVKEEALSNVILFGERSLRHTLKQYQTHYHEERPHQGKDNVILMSSFQKNQKSNGPIRCRERLGGLLKFYHREAA